jgi:lysozyme family protein
MEANFAPALARVLVYEGGKANNPKDPGGKTNFGVTQRTYSAWLVTQKRPSADVYNITHDEVATIYKNEYWDKVHGDDLPSGLDLVVFDGAVNSGVGTSVMWLQGALGISIDGGIGAKTEAAIVGCDDEKTIDAYCSRRLGSLERLTTWSTFGKGWSARISNCKKIGDAWAEAGAGENVGPAPVQVDSLGGHNKASMDDLKTSAISVVATHAVTAGSAVATGATQALTTLSGVGDTFSWMKYVLGGITIASACAGLVVMFGNKANNAANNGVATSTVPPNADDGLPTTAINDNPAPASPTAVIEAHVLTAPPTLPLATKAA